jgi:hypothetical protein
MAEQGKGSTEDPSSTDPGFQNDEEDDNGKEEKGGGGGEEEEEEEEREYEMEEDVYTLMFAYGFSFTTLYAVVTVFLQLTIVGLFYVDLLKDNTENNKLKVPIVVDTQGAFSVLNNFLFLVTTVRKVENGSQSNVSELQF